MTENNSETVTESTPEISTTTDTISTPVDSAVDVEQSTNAEAEISDGESVEGTETQEQESDLYYDINGEEVSAQTVLEWKQNGLRQADYTKKTQQAAEIRKQAEAKLAETAELNAKLADTLATLEKSIKDEASSIDWEYLRENDTGEYLKQKELLQKKAKQALSAKAELEQRQKAEFDQQLAVEQKLLLESQPTWQDAKQREADFSLIDDYVTAAGFTDAEVKSLTNHKVMNAVLDAARYKALQNKSAATAKEVQKAPKVVKASTKSKTKPKSRSELFYGT